MIMKAYQSNILMMRNIVIYAKTDFPASASLLARAISD